MSWSESWQVLVSRPQPSACRAKGQPVALQGHIVIVVCPPSPSGLSPVLTLARA